LSIAHASGRADWIRRAATVGKVEELFEPER
jgi:hypothetical protein